MLPLNFLLSPHLQNLPVRVRVPRRHECRARGGTVFGYKPARLEPDPARVAQRLRAHGPGPPLRRLLGGAVEALPARSLGGVPLIVGRRFGGRGVGGWVGGGEEEEAGGPVAGGGA